METIRDGCIGRVEIIGKVLPGVHTRSGVAALLHEYLAPLGELLNICKRTLTFILVGWRG